MLRTRLLPPLAVIGALGVAALVVVSAPSPVIADVTAVNPVRVDLNGHPANSGFLVFIEGDVFLNADEAEGTIALGGDLAFGTTYSIQAGSTPVFPTFTAPGDAGPTYLYVGGGIDWSGSSTAILRVLGGGFTKVADTTTFSAGNIDGNGATALYQIREPGQPYDSQPRIEGTTNAQDGASVAEPVPGDLIDIAGAFTLYRTLSTDLGECLTTVQLTNPDSGEPLVPGWAAGTRGRLALNPDETNVLELAATDLAALAEITFTGPPTASTPLVINVTGASFNGTTPNLAGVSGLQAPFILWNFPQATSITVSGGDSLEGTVYAPRAELNWVPTQNIEGNVIAASFTHGPTPLGGPVPREIHDLPFNTEVSCLSDTNTTTTTTTTVPDSTTVPESTTTTPSSSTSTSVAPDVSTSTVAVSTTTPSGAGAGGVSSGGGNLAGTGSDARGIMAVAIAGLLVGAVLIVVSRWPWPDSAGGASRGATSVVRPRNPRER